jgi:hypothetical protein
MPLSQRPVRPEDFFACFETLGEPQFFASAVRARVPEVLRFWWESGAMVGHLIEDLRELCSPRPVGLSIVVFVSDALMNRVHAGTCPFVRNALIEQELSGHPAVLAASQIREAQRENGLNLLYFNHALTHRGLPENERHQVHGSWADTFLDLRGYHLKEILCEVHQEQVCQWGLSCGMEPRQHWAALAVEPGGVSTPVYQIGTTKAEALRRIGSSAADLFYFVAPRFGFSRRQQELLSVALQGATDQALARELHLSLAAVKKR